MMLPRLSYPITRSFRWRFFETVVYSVAPIALGLLVPLNYALVGYETVTVALNDFRAVPHHWFDSFITPPEPGSLCENHTPSLGDAVVTNYSIFTYTIQSVTESDGTYKSTFQYSGTNLDDCDVSEVNVMVDVWTSTASTSAQVTCFNPAFVFTTTNTSPLWIGSINGTTRSDDNACPGCALPGGLRENVTNLVKAASVDLSALLYNLFVLSNNAGYAVVNVEVDLGGGGPSAPSTSSSLCPKGQPSSINPNCTEVPLNINILNADITATLANGSTYVFYPPNNIATQALTIAFSNLAQTMVAAVRIDIGNPWPENNFIINTSVINATILQIPPIGLSEDNPNLFLMEPTLPQTLGTLDVQGGYTPPRVDTSRSAMFNIDYLCHTTRARQPGSAFVYVFSATSTMFTTGWAVFMLVARYLATWERPRANYCDKCNDDFQDVHELGYHLAPRDGFSGYPPDKL